MTPLVENEAFRVGYMPRLAAEPTWRAGPISPRDLAGIAGQDSWNELCRFDHNREFRRHAR
jgi:hypothetical protein